MINNILILASLVIFGMVVVILYLRAKSQVVKVEPDNYNSIEKVLEGVKNTMVDILRDNYTTGLSQEEFEKMYKRQARVNEALKNCVHGIESAKILVIDLIRGFIAEKVPKENITHMLGLDEGGEPSSHVKFEIIMYMYKKHYGKQALAKWIDKYDFANERQASEATSEYDQAYYITEEDLDNSYRAENYKLNIEEQMDVLAILVYQLYKGFGIIDTLREMDINGINCGTSGSIMLANSKLKEGEFRANKSVWLYYQGKYIHLRFMNFGTEDELRRIIQLLIRWGNPGPLTAKRGYLVNTMYDKSRITALRPPAAEYWAVFIRKFTLADVSPEALIIKPYTANGQLAVKLVEFLIRAQVTCGITGRMGSGKTTFMSSIVRFIDPRFNIRILELAPELYLRELYPTRNIMSVQETATVTATELQDTIKKTDGAVTMVGEVASDPIAARMIQMGQVASLFTLFSHHAVTSKDLVLSLRNSLMQAGNITNAQAAEKQVTDVVKMDIHWDYTPDGKRFIERITEIIQIEEGQDYPEYDEADSENSINKITREYYKRSTDRVGFITRDIMVYDKENHTYKVANRISKQLEDKMREKLGVYFRDEYDYFMLKNWGPRDDEETSAEVVEKELNRLEGIVESRKENKSPAIGEIDEYKYSDVDAKQIETDAQDKEVWAKGYGDDIEEDTDISSEFNIGLFYDEDEVSKQCR